jgi:hypothetical protein
MYTKIKYVLLYRNVVVNLKLLFLEYNGMNTIKIASLFR